MNVIAVVSHKVIHPDKENLCTDKGRAHTTLKSQKFKVMEAVYELIPPQPQNRLLFYWFTIFNFGVVGKIKFTSKLLLLLITS